MSGETPEEATARERAEDFFRLLGEGDVDRLANLFAEQIDWFVPGDGSLPWTGRRSQRSEIPEYFELMAPYFVAEEIELTLFKIFVNGPDAVLLAHFARTVKANGRRLSLHVAFHFTVENGQIVRMHMYEDTALVTKTIGALD